MLDLYMTDQGESEAELEARLAEGDSFEPPASFVD